MSEKYFRNEFIEIWIENGIIHAIYAPYVEITREMAEHIVAERHKLTEGKTYPYFGDVTKAKTLNREARKVFSSNEGTRGISAAAFLIKTQIEAFLLNAWFSIYGTPFPVKLFTEKKKALEWLETFKRIN